MLPLIIMTDKKNWLIRFLDKKRVRITPRHYRRNIKITIFFIAFILPGILMTISVNSGDRVLIIGTAILTLVLISISILLTNTYFKSIALKGDSVLIKSLRNRNTVTSVRSIQDVKSRHLAGLTFTRFRFILDGKTNNIVLINRTSTLLFTPEASIRRAILEYKK